MNNETPSISRIVKLAAVLAVVVIAGVAAPECMETVAAGDIVVKSGFFNGELAVWNQPGVYAQNFGRLTTYQKSFQASFVAPPDGSPAGTQDDSIKVQFNDGAVGHMSVTLRVNMPLAADDIVKLHTTYRSQEAIMNDLVEKQVAKAVYMTGSLISSKESYAERKNDLLQYIEDQLANGVYKTETEEKTVNDPLSGTKVVTVVRVSKDPKTGIPLRQEPSTISAFGLKTFGLTVAIHYDDIVTQQIKQQQEAAGNVQTSMAKAKEAEQDAFTAQKQGEATAAKSKWAQEAINATEIAKAEKNKQVAVNQAEQARDVAKLGQEAAGYEKQKQILLGEGEGARKKAAMMANGALEEKLAAWVEVNKSYAEALAAHQIVPNVQFSGGSGSGGGATDLVQLLTAKTAHDIGLEFGKAK